MARKKEKLILDHLSPINCNELSEDSNLDLFITHSVRHLLFIHRAFVFPVENELAKLSMETLSPYAHLLRKMVYSSNKLATDFDTWALAQHHEKLYISADTTLPRDAVLTTEIIERAFDELRARLGGNDVVEREVFFAGTDLRLYLETVREDRPISQYVWLYRNVTQQMIAASASAECDADYDFPRDLLFIESVQRFVWEEREFEAYQCTVTSAAQVLAPRKDGVIFFLVSVFQQEDHNLCQLAFEHNVRCMKMSFPHSVVYQLILQVRLRYSTGKERPREPKNYPNDFLDRAVPVPVMDDDDDNGSEQERPANEYDDAMEVVEETEIDDEFGLGIPIINFPSNAV